MQQCPGSQVELNKLDVPTKLINIYFGTTRVKVLLGSESLMRLYKKMIVTKDRMG